LLDDVHDQFITAVSEGRGMEYEEVKKLSDGRIFTGKKAMELGLVDELGNLNYAIKKAGELGGIEGEPRVVSSKKRIGFWDILSGNLPEGLMKKGLTTVRLSYIFAP
ncbi:MAG TPA: signal peptide peptidase SppA, partial [Nitrospirae bacterium]|nr:signal peptide peptidase SppA [Nitrospirota bacterium]